MTCNPVPTARASSPSRAVSANSAMATTTESGNAHSGTLSSTVGDDPTTAVALAVLDGVARPVPARRVWFW